MQSFAIYKSLNRVSKPYLIVRHMYCLHVPLEQRKEQTNESEKMGFIETRKRPLSRLDLELRIDI